MTLRQSSPRLLVLIVLPAMALGLAACGGGSDDHGRGNAATTGTPARKATLPPGVIAKVGDETITKEQYHRSYAKTSRHVQSPWVGADGNQVGGGPDVVVDPPKFTRCMAAYRASDKRLPEGMDGGSTPNVKQRCQEQYKRDRARALSTLIETAQLKQDAAKQDISAQPADLREELTRERQIYEVARGLAGFSKSQPRSRAGRQRQFEASKGGRAQMLREAKTQVVKDELLDHAIAKKSRVTDADLLAYYRHNLKRFSHAPQRDILVIVAKTKARAEQAKARLEAGASFQSVAKRLKLRGGKSRLEEGKVQEAALKAATFDAVPDVISGPITTSLGWAVFAVTAARPAGATPLAQVRKTLRKELHTQRVEKAKAAYDKDLVERTKQNTTCASRYAVELCGNIPLSH